MSVTGLFNMTTRSFIIAQILFFWVCIDLNCASAINRDNKRNASLINSSYYDNDRESRQYFGGYGSSLGASSHYGGLGGLGGFGGPIEAIIIGLLVVFGLGIIGIPFFLLFMSLFNVGGIGTGGLNLVPTTTTTVAGRKKREVDSILPKVNPEVQQKLLNIFENFIEAPDKIKMVEKLLESVIGRN